jgi:hypothetical protein
MNQYVRCAVVYSGVMAAVLFGTRSMSAQNTSGAAALQGTISHGTAIIHGTVTDATGGIIPGAKVQLMNSAAQTLQQTEAGSDGSYSFRGVAPGTYSVVASFPGLQQQSPIAVSAAPGRSVTANIMLVVQEQKQEVTVTGGTNQVSTEPANNATALVLRQEDLDALPDDPDDLQADLEALAGPAAGPGGTQFFIDGFTGGQMPPKSSIREIRINTNPFAAEFDKLGYGRIEIFTKPGTDRFHGSGYFDASDDIWNARNPFLKVSPPFRTELFGGNVSGPINKHASFFIDVERRNIDDNGVVTATLPTPDFLGIQSAGTFYPTPQQRTRVSPRVDYQIGSNNTLSMRYSYVGNDHLLEGIGPFSLPNTTVGNIVFPSAGFTSNLSEQEFRIVDTAVLSAKAINETHFEFDRSYENSTSQSTAPALDVQSSFSSGGSGYSAPGYPRSYDLENYYEMQNYTTLTEGPHTVKFGLRIRASMIDDTSVTGFNGQWQFNGGTFPIIGSDGLPIPGTSEQLSSIEQYLTTVRLLNMGLSSAQVTAMGYGPSKYTVTVGNPYLGLSQLDFGPFIQDDWRVSPNFTLSMGLRWESQTNISDHSDWAPRLGFAWAPFGNKQRSKTVIRGGWGIFYDRFSAANVEVAERQNGLNQQVYTVDPLSLGLVPGCNLTYNAAFSTAPAIGTLAACGASSTPQIYRIDSHLQAPRLMQTAIGVEQQLFSHTTLSINYLNSRGVHEFRLVDINAPYPIPGDLPPGTPASVAARLGIPVSPSTDRPFPNEGDIYDYQSDGIFKQSMVLINVNSQIGGYVTLFTRYSHGIANTNTNGLSALTSDPYDYNADWGRSSLNIENNFFLGGSIMAPWGLRFSPFIIIHSGVPFNLTTGNDLFLQGKIGMTARPMAVSGAGPYVIATPYGYLDPYPVVPVPGTSDFVPLNDGIGPGFLGINMRVSKTWGFGTTKFEGPSGGAHAGGGGYHGRGGFGGFGVAGPHGIFNESSEHRYNLTLSLNARNILNHTNLNTPIGAITSPLFLQSNGITGGYSAESTSSENRRMDLQLRFTF